eukprot:CAMPEP_0167746006 /NCGR_PEP_ID=MMETSP0110_2-20121227/3467_1 /TAXON_ID=629695 /ORGANISM="Gymnochlora sp., Strain CCMP2014" /LENGTH=43 /DNA_ID= /DNA_START= /DNA_END= /DNA_ORIENTATION=
MAHRRGDKIGALNDKGAVAEVLVPRTDILSGMWQGTSCLQAIR